MRSWYLAFLTFAALSGCNSLINESERIRQAHNFKNSDSPAVTSTDPSDGAVGPYSQNYIDITYSTGLDGSSVSVQGTTGACSGSLQFSTDNFSTCIGGSADTSANPRVRFTPTVMPRGVTIRIHSTTQVTNQYGKPALDYFSPTGFAFQTLCGASNCFFSTSLPLLSNAGSSTGMFLIRSGTHMGKLVIFSAGQTATTMVDFTAITSSAGPSFPAAPSAGAHSFPITQGPDNGKEMVVAGGSTAYIYDPSTHTFSSHAGPAAASANAFSFPVPAGAQAGQTLTVNGSPSAVINAYPDNLGNFTTFTTLPGPNLPGAGVHALRLSAGSAASYLFFVFGNGTSETRFFDEASGSFVAGPALAGTAGQGAGSFVVSSGPLLGRMLTVLGGGNNTTNQYNISTSSNEGNGPTLTQNANNGGQLLYRHGTALANTPLVLHGGLLGTTTSRFDSDNGVFKPGPATHGAMGNGSSILYLPSTVNQGYFFIVNGLSLVNTHIYSISNHDFVGNTMPGTTPNAGAHAIYITTGLHQGRTLVVAGGTTRDTALYDPPSHGFYAGPQTVDTISASGFSVMLTRGPYAGRIVTFKGGGANTYNVYNPQDGAFKSMLDVANVVGGTPLALNTGANAFEIEGDGRILVLNGSGTTTQFIDQQNYSFVTTGAPTTSCAVAQAFNLRYTRPSDGRAMQLVWCSGSNATVFDHVAQTFSAQTLPGGGTGLQAFVIASGTERGNIALVHGGGLAWSILSAEDLSVIGGARSLSTCTATAVSTGSQVMAITTGAQAGHHLLVIGNNSQETCDFDPAALQFTAGPKTNAVASPGYQIVNGSVTFATRGGAYPTGWVLLSGTNKNVWSTYVP